MATASRASLIALTFAALLLAACSPKDETGPGEVRWDRDTCARCVMAVSDHKYSAQVRGGHENRRTKLHFFDDLGCAVIWLDEQPWRDDPRTEIWVNDHESGEWVDAREAWYVTGRTTPMDYGLGARDRQVEGALDYDEAVKWIHERDKRPKWHGQERHHTPENGG